MNEKKTNTSSDRSILVMDAAAIRRALRRIAHEIVERNPDLNANRPRWYSVARK